MNAACATSGPANVEPVIHGGLMNNQFLVFRAKMDIPAYSGELLWSYTMSGEQSRVSEIRTGALLEEEAAAGESAVPVPESKQEEDDENAEEDEEPEEKEARRQRKAKAARPPPAKRAPIAPQAHEDAEAAEEDEEPEEEEAQRQRLAKAAKPPPAKRARIAPHAPEISENMLVDIQEATVVARFGGKFAGGLVFLKEGADVTVVARLDNKKTRQLPRGYIIYECAGQIKFQDDWVAVPYNLLTSSKVLLDGKLTTSAKTAIHPLSLYSSARTFLHLASFHGRTKLMLAKKHQVALAPNRRGTP
jgi:hypothetical protein